MAEDYNFYYPDPGEELPSGWRDYTDPTTGEYVWTDSPASGASSPASSFGYGQPQMRAMGGGFPMVGGTQGISDAQWQLQQEYLRKQLQWQQYMDWAGATGQLPANTEQGAVEFIIKNRPDVLEFYKNNGWKLDSPGEVRRAVQDWLRMSPEGQAAGGDLIKTALNMGMPTGGGSTLPAQAMKWQQDVQFPWQKDVTRGQMTGMLGDTPTLAKTQQEFEQNIRFPKEFGLSQAGLMGYDEQGRPTMAGQAQSWRQQTEFPEQQRLLWGQLLASKSGPRDYRQYEALQRAAQGGGAFGPMAATPSWEGATRDWAGGTGTRDAWMGLPAENVRGTTQQGERNTFRQPISIRPQDFARMGPSQRLMQESDWAASGLDPDDAWSNMRRGWLSSGPGVSAGTSYR